MENNLLEINLRQRRILEAIVREYNKTVLPVSSGTLVRKYHLDLSPATVRFEMFALTREDYLYKPHISAGRVPTDKAYQFFVREIKGGEFTRKSLNKKEREEIKASAKENKNKDARVKKITETIAELSHTFSFGSPPHQNLWRGDKFENDFFDAGLNWLLREPEFRSRDQILGLFDSFDELKKIVWDIDDDLRIFIGRDLSKKFRDCSLVARSYRLPDGEKSIFGILGPRRMDYAKNISIVNYLAEIFDSY